MKFLHMADLHLGQRHMQLQTRFEDFFQTFEEILAHARMEKVDFCIICGDMFDKKQLDAETLLRTSRALMKMKDAGIPVFAIEGNHDQRLYADQHSFLDYLSKEELLLLLRPSLQEGKEFLEPWNQDLKEGGVYTFQKNEEVLQLIGIGYITSSIQEEKIHMVKEYLDSHSSSPSLLMMHGSIGGGIPGSLDKSLLDPLKNHISYVGLGHWHRRMEVDGWIYNPGSMEHTDINREDISKGYFLVDMKGTTPHVIFFESGKRPALRMTLSVKGAKDLDEALGKIEEQVLPYKEKYDPEIPLMCKCTLRGKVDFNPLELSKKILEQSLSKHLPLLFLEYENLLTTKDVEIGEDFSLAELSSSALEQEVLGKLIAQSSEFKEEPGLMEKIRSMKQALLQKETPEHIISLLE